MGWVEWKDGSNRIQANGKWEQITEAVTGNSSTGPIEYIHIFIMIPCSVIQVQVYSGATTDRRVCVCVYGFHVYKGVLVYVLCTQCITIFKQPATWTRTIVKATSTLKIQSSAKHCTSVNYCWKLFWSQLDSYILVWLHGLGLHTLIIYFFVCVAFSDAVVRKMRFYAEKINRW